MSKFIEWEDWPLYVEAKEMWDKVVPHLTEEELEDLGPFNTSFNYLAARVAYRRYLNHSPSGETT